MLCWRRCVIAALRIREAGNPDSGIRLRLCAIPSTVVEHEAGVVCIEQIPGEQKNPNSVQSRVPGGCGLLVLRASTNRRAPNLTRTRCTLTVILLYCLSSACTPEETCVPVRHFENPSEPDVWVSVGTAVAYFVPGSPDDESRRGGCGIRIAFSFEDGGEVALDASTATCTAGSTMQLPIGLLIGGRCIVPAEGVELQITEAEGALSDPLPANFRRRVHGTVPPTDTECGATPELEFDVTVRFEDLKLYTATCG